VPGHGGNGKFLWRRPARDVDLIDGLPPRHLQARHEPRKQASQRGLDDSGFGEKEEVSQENIARWVCDHGPPVDPRSLFQRQQPVAR
jgi:hypothetical protein